MMWGKLRKFVSLRKVTQLLMICIGLVVLYGFWVRCIDHGRPLVVRKSSLLCQHSSRNNLVWTDTSGHPGERSNSHTRQHALLFLHDGLTQSGKQMLYMFQATRMKYHVQYGVVHNLPALIDNDKGRYAAIVFEDVNIYLQMNQWNRDSLDKYCVEYNVGVVVFVPSREKKTARILDDVQLGDFPLTYTTCMDLKDGIINPDSEILRITKSDEQIKGHMGQGWSIFKSNHTTYQTILSAFLTNPRMLKQKNNFVNKHRPVQRISSRMKRKVSGIFSGFNIFTKQDDEDDLIAATHTSMQIESEAVPIVMADTGKYDQIRRVIFGNNLEFWLNKVLFMDALSYLSNGKLSLPLERYMQVDVDDIFVSAVGLRMKKEDVLKMIEFQDEMRTRVPGFSFLLGFSGKFFKKGAPEENEGDAIFLEESDKFLWFPHMWSHMQAHLFSNNTTLCKYMKPNREFAKRHKFNVSTKYAVAPHHSGIFPVHEPLYECWKKIWDIETTSTEEYPNLRPDTKRRGFVYKGIRVLPRQTCGLFTHTNFFEKYPGGPEKLNSLIHGGQLFQTMLLNRYNIYMTHFSNYGSDRLALYVFGQVVKFVQCWTNLRLLQVPPSELAQKYFSDYHDEVDPVWTNPCTDPRHLEIWSKDKSCERLPSFVIVGPQKTGTTALHWFLQMHPNLQTSLPSQQTFEEVQFFNTPNYLKGLDWYMNFFPMPNKEDETIFYEKSANYFNYPHAPRRLAALLPKAHIIILLIDPAKRAYSWYQHIRSHKDPVALNYTFDEVIKGKKRSLPSVLSLQAKCLLPGRYAEYIDKWLEYLSSEQIIIVDGELLAKDPAHVLQKLQKDLGLDKIFNYSKVIRFQAQKGFFCRIEESGATKCLGKGKGRQYPEMTEESRLYLQNYFSDSNKRLFQILKDLRRPIPTWLAPDNSTVA